MSVDAGKLDLTAFSGSTVLLLTTGGVVAGDSANPIPELQSRRNALVAVANAALDSALRRDGRSVTWMGLEEQRSVARRNPTLGLDPDRLPTVELFPPGIEVVGSLGALVSAADHVVLAAPSTPATRHLLGGAAFAAMRPGTHLVNVARGALVDQEALRVALDDGRVARASLDAVEPEPLPRGHWMYRHPRVRLSAHVSWSMPGARATPC